MCGFSSVDRALPCQGRGREFESLNPHHFYFWPIWPFFNVFETKNNPLKIRGLATVFVACVATLFAMLVVVVAIKLSNHNFVLFNHNVTIMTQKKSRVKPGTACVSFL